VDGRVWVPEMDMENLANFPQPLASYSQGSDISNIDRLLLTATDTDTDTDTDNALIQTETSINSKQFF